MTANLQDDFQLPSSGRKKPVQQQAALKQESLSTQDGEQEANPTEGSEENSKKSKYPKEELLKIFDEIIFMGEYEERPMIKGKLQVGFRTRSGGEIDEINRAVDTSKANLMTTLNDMRTMLNLQYSLTQYHTRDLRGMSAEDKAKFIRTIPAPVIASLLTALQEFDEKVFLACQEGEENF